MTHSLLITLALILSPVLCLASSEEPHTTAGVDSKFVFSVINFILMGALLFWLLKKPFKNFFKNRAQNIQTSIEESQVLKQNALDRFNQIESRLKNAQHEANELIQTITEQAESEKSQIITQAQTLAQKILEDTKKIADQEILRAKKELQNQAILLATQLAKQKIKDQITPEDQIRLGQDFISQLKQTGTP